MEPVTLNFIPCASHCTDLRKTESEGYVPYRGMGWDSVHHVVKSLVQIIKFSYKNKNITYRRKA